MALPEEVILPLRVSLERLADDSLLLDKFAFGKNKGKITAERLEQAAGNHLFDDYFEELGITKAEGHKIRAYFQNGVFHNDYSFVSDLHRTFPELISQEREIYIFKINVERSWRGLPELSSEPPYLSLAKND